MQWAGDALFSTEHSVPRKAEAIHHFKSLISPGAMSYTLLPAFRRQMQADFCEFQASLVYEMSSRTVRKVTQRNPISNKQKQANKTR